MSKKVSAMLKMSEDFLEVLCSNLPIWSIEDSNMLFSDEIDEYMQRSHSEITTTTTSSFYVPGAAVMSLITMITSHLSAATNTSLFASLFSKKKAYLREVIIHISIIKHDEHDVGFTLPTNIITCNVPSDITISQLKLHLVKLYRIVYSIHLLYCGEILHEEENPLPETCFEVSNQILTEDELVFKPRLVCSINCNYIDDNYVKLLKINQPNTGIDYMEQMESGDEASQITDPNNNNNGQQNHHHGHHKHHLEGTDGIHFNLYEELKQIQCQLYYDHLLHAGYHQEGSFANITEDDFAINHLYIPKQARLRILSLSEIIRRRMQAALELQQAKHQARRANRQGGGGDGGSNDEESSIKGGATVMSSDGQPLEFNSKKHLKELWNKVKSHVLPTNPHDHSHSQLAAFTDARAKEGLSDEVKLKIAEIKRKFAISEDVRYADVKTVKASNAYCCPKHEYQANQRMSEIVLYNKQQFRAQLTARFSWITDSNSEVFAPLHIMVEIAVDNLQRHWHWHHENSSNSSNNNVDFLSRGQIQAALYQKASITIQEIRSLETQYEEFQEVPQTMSISSFRMYSKEKFINLLIDYIDQQYPHFFLRSM